MMVICMFGLYSFLYKKLKQYKMYIKNNKSKCTKPTIKN